jgi:hypothetical protein
MQSSFALRQVWFKARIIQNGKFNSLKEFKNQNSVSEKAISEVKSIWQAIFQYRGQFKWLCLVKLKTDMRVMTLI